MNIAVIGGGRVGLPAAAGFAAIGHRVACCESDDGRRAAISVGRAPFADAGLGDALVSGIASGALRICADIVDAADGADAVFIAVQTGDGANGLCNLHAAARLVAKHAAPSRVLIIKSTVPPGTCARLDTVLRRKMTVAYNPEFLRQGFGFVDFMSPFRIVAGADDADSASVMRAIYAPITGRNGTRYIETSRVAAETAKLAANMMLSSKVALINEISDLCEAVGGNIDEVTEVLSSDRRIGGKFLCPGTGFGGACLPKDGRLLIAAAQNSGVAVPAAESLFSSNRNRADRIARRIANMLPPDPLVAIWGLAFKPGADDICDSPAIAIARRLYARGVKINGYDGMLPSAMRTKFPEANWFDRPLDSLADADGVAILTGHKEFSLLSAETIKSAMKGNAVFDCAGIFRRAEMECSGLYFDAIGGR